MAYASCVLQGNRSGCFLLTPHITECETLQMSHLVLSGLRDRELPPVILSVLQRCLRLLESPERGCAALWEGRMIAVSNPRAEM